jgi:hypothetical protein
MTKSSEEIMTNGAGGKVRVEGVGWQIKISQKDDIQ